MIHTDDGDAFAITMFRTTVEFEFENGTLSQEDRDTLRIGPAHVYPRATEHIAEMVALIGRLIATGHAYAAEGHVLFDISSFDNYGALSGRDAREMIAGSRVEVAPFKRNPGDFVLWKPSEDGQPGWDSPWGRGRPGWHIECSAMAYELLGETFDIHGGANERRKPTFKIRQWRSLRDSEDAKNLGLAMPRFLARQQYGAKTDPVEEFDFEEDTEGAEHNKFTWANSAYSMALNINQSFKEFGWCSQIRGVESGGTVEGLPVHTFPSDDGGVDMK